MALPEIIDFDGLSGKWTWRLIERRPPKKGEYYLSGAIPTAYKAPNDLSTPYMVIIPMRRYVPKTIYVPEE